MLSIISFMGCSEDVIKKAKINVPFVDTGVDSNAWALVPAGKFYEGIHAHAKEVKKPFEIMITHVTNDQYVDYLTRALAAGKIKIKGNDIMGFHKGDKFDKYHHEFEIKDGDKLHVRLNEPGLRIRYDGKTFSVQKGFGNHPMTMVTWYGAKAYAEFFGWYLPTEIQWERAARGDDKRAYPWGDTIKRNQVNFYASRDPYEKIFGKMGGTTPVGFYNGKTHNGYKTVDAKSPYGLYDMAGNAWQWCGDDYADQHYRYMRGGSHGNYEHETTAWTRNNSGPEYYSISVGFRCARDVKKI